MTILFLLCAVLSVVGERRGEPDLCCIHPEPEVTEQAAAASPTGNMSPGK